MDAARRGDPIAAGILRAGVSQAAAAVASVVARCSLAGAFTLVLSGARLG